MDFNCKAYLKSNEWVKLFKECDYTGYYDFIILKLINA